MEVLVLGNRPQEGAESKSASSDSDAGVGMNSVLQELKKVRVVGPLGTRVFERGRGP